MLKSIKIVDDNGRIYGSLRKLSEHLNVSRDFITKRLKDNGYLEFNGRTYSIYTDSSRYQNSDIENATDFNNADIEIDEYKEFQQYKSVKEQGVEVYKFNYTERESGYKYAVALFSDAHIEETVNPENILNLNEYNIDIAKQRIETYFQNLARCLNRDEVDELIFASLGDTISGYIHEELSQQNSMTPVEATFIAQSILFSGLKFLCENTNINNIKFIGIVGNHSRTTKKIQHSNGYKMSYEYLMYKNIERQCKECDLPIEIYIPESEFAIISTPGDKKFIFCHGFQVRGGTNTVCGIYPALQRLSLKWNKIIKQDKIYMGHFHQCISIPNAVVNGSIIGYNSFALSNGMSYEEPAQMYEVYDTKIGHICTRKIYCK